MTGAANQRYSVTDLAEFNQKVEARLEVELEKLLKIDDHAERMIKAEYGIYKRLMYAHEWLTMMQACVATDEAVIILKSTVALAMWDAEII